MRTAMLIAVVAVLSACTAPGPQRVTPPTDATSAAPTALGQRAAHTATALLDGSVLVAGGCDVDGCSTPTGSTFLLTSQGARATPPLHQPRAGHTATRLEDGSSPAPRPVPRSPGWAAMWPPSAPSAWSGPTCGSSAAMTVSST